MHEFRIDRLSVLYVIASERKRRDLRQQGIGIRGQALGAHGASSFVYSMQTRSVELIRTTACTDRHCTLVSLLLDRSFVQDSAQPAGKDPALRTHEERFMSFQQQEEDASHLEAAVMAAQAADRR